jgi:hypothetical protein
MSHMKDIFFDVMELGDFSFYDEPDRTAIYTRIPICFLDHFRSLNKGQYKIRYRGPRAHRANRSPISKATTCLKEDATHFSVYNY